jgi:hypothetical protein
MSYYKELAAYKREFGNFYITKKTTLRLWVKEQRELLKEGKQSADRVARLHSIGFCTAASRKSSLAITAKRCRCILSNSVFAPWRNKANEFK